MKTKKHSPVKPPYTPKKIQSLIPKDFPEPSKKEIASVLRAVNYLVKAKNYDKPYVEVVGGVVVLSQHSYLELLEGLLASLKSQKK